MSLPLELCPKAWRSLDFLIFFHWFTSDNRGRAFGREISKNQSDKLPYFYAIQFLKLQVFDVKTQIVLLKLNHKPTGAWACLSFSKKSGKFSLIQQEILEAHNCMSIFYCQDPLKILNFLRLQRAEEFLEGYSAKYYPLNLHLTLLFGSKPFSHIIVCRWRAKL